MPGDRVAMAPVQRTVDQLQQLLALSVRTGQITLNLREGRLESFETKTYARLEKCLTTQSREA